MARLLFMSIHAKRVDMQPRPRALLLMLDFARWEQAKPLSYTVTCAIEEGLTQNGFDCTVLPALADVDPTSPQSWMYHAERLLAGQTFDQVWVWLVHLAPPTTFFEWLKTVAPVRVGMLVESLTYPDADHRDNPGINNRWEKLQERLPYLTHVLTSDEADVDLINSAGQASAFWCLGMIPARFIRPSRGLLERRKEIAFFGSVYKKREDLLSQPELRGMITIAPQAEHATDIPLRFNKINSTAIHRINIGEGVTTELAEAHYRALRGVRIESFEALLSRLAEWRGTINLPSYLRGLTGRVFESIAAGTPVISWLLPDRPMANSVFTDGSEILQFDAADPKSLASKVRLLINEPTFALELAEKAREKLSHFHTAEIRIAQILSWISSGAVPDYRGAPRPILRQEGDAFLSRYYSADVPDFGCNPGDIQYAAAMERIKERVVNGDVPGAIRELSSAIKTFPGDKQLPVLLDRLQSL